MASLIDTPNDVGNPDRVVQQLTENSSMRTEPTTRANRQQIEDSTDPRFRGKSAADIADMYKNLERHSGSLANEVGQLRRVTDEILLSKRRDDLQKGGQNDPIEIKPTDLLERPTEALDRYFSNRMTTAVEPLRQHIANLETQLATSQLNSSHADAAEIASSEEFTDWVKETPMRKSVAQLARSGNVKATQDLLTEYKKTRVEHQDSNDESHNLNDALNKAQKISLERGRTSSDGVNTRPEGKIYNRTDLIALKMRDPDKYEQLADEITKAYMEKRVR